MELKRLFFIGLLLFLCACADDTLDQAPQEACAMDKVIKSKEAAKAAIIGKWRWLETTYTSRGADKATENPLTANKTVVFEFERDTLKIYENGILAGKPAYEIRYWGEGSNTVDEQLAIIIKGSQAQTNLLFLSRASGCLTLVNSYNDAGGDMYFKREN